MFLKRLGVSGRTMLAIACYSCGLIAQPNQAEDAIQLVLTQRDARYCEGAGDVGTMHLDCEFRFINAGPNSVILSRSAGLITQLILRNSSDGRTPLGPALELSVSQLLEGGHGPDSDVPEPACIVLRKGQALQIRRTVIIPFSRESSVPGTVPPGVYSVQVWVQTWLDSKKEGEIMKGRWAKWGELWTRPILSNPLQIRIDRNARMRTCK